MAHRVNDHPSRLPVAQAAVLALPPPGQAKVSAVSLRTHSRALTAVQMRKCVTCDDMVCLQNLKLEIVAQLGHATALLSVLLLRINTISVLYKYN